MLVAAPVCFLKLASLCNWPRSLRQKQKWQKLPSYSQALIQANRIKVSEMGQRNLYFEKLPAWFDAAGLSAASLRATVISGSPISVIAHYTKGMKQGSFAARNTWVQFPSPPLPKLVALGKSLHLSKSLEVVPSGCGWYYMWGAGLYPAIQIKIESNSTNHAVLTCFHGTPAPDWGSGKLSLLSFHHLQNLNQ